MCSIRRTPVLPHRINQSPAGLLTGFWPLIMAMTVGQTIAPIVDLPEGLQVHVAQYQPTERPIEDRYSVNLSNDGRRLVIGVYDGQLWPCLFAYILIPQGAHF